MLSFGPICRPILQNALARGLRASTTTGHVGQHMPSGSIPIPVCHQCGWLISHCRGRRESKLPDKEALLLLLLLADMPFGIWLSRESQRTLLLARASYMRALTTTRGSERGESERRRREKSTSSSARSQPLHGKTS
jgi:hypothetical protein